MASYRLQDVPAVVCEVFLLPYISHPKVIFDLQYLLPLLQLQDAAHNAKVLFDLFDCLNNPDYFMTFISTTTTLKLDESQLNLLMVICNQPGVVVAGSCALQALLGEDWFGGSLGSDVDLFVNTGDVDMGLWSTLEQFAETEPVDNDVLLDAQNEKR